MVMIMVLTPVHRTISFFLRSSVLLLSAFFAFLFLFFWLSLLAASSGQSLKYGEGEGYPSNYTVA